TCFRVNSYGNITVDKRGGAFADDLYVVIDDNRNGTIKSSDVDVFLFKSTNGGDTWIGPTRVNDDPTLEPSGSKAPGTSWANTPPGFDRDCGRDPQNISGDASKCTVDPVGNDQFFPWVDISDAGDVNVVFQDRRLDTGSIASEWPTSRTRSGNYLSWFWGAQCRVSTADSRDCVADEALEYSGSPTGPVDPGADPVPGQSQAEFPFRGFTISDTPSNLDYAFRAGIFAGDYENVDVNGTQAHAMWTDARNGRSSRAQSGRNPACEQSDAFVDSFSASDGGTKSTARESDALFLVTPCPADAADPGNAGTTVPQPTPPGTPVALPTPPSGTEVAATPQPVANATKTAPLVGGQSVVKQARLALARVRVLRVRSVGRVVLVRVNGTVSTARVRVVLRAKSGRLLRVATRSVPTNRLTRVPNLRLDRNVAKVKVTLAR
ncbi:MAG: hypothetical protein H0V40_00005, partial [Actinobacteria bacterium]|nr:hypothetical protein [Actinomycetota bacterium]